MSLRVKFTAIPPQHAGKLREHVVRSKDSTFKEKIEALGRDEKGRIRPLTPRTETPNDGQRAESEAAVAAGPKP